MKKLLIFTLIFLPLFSVCQRVHLNLFGGFSNYQGDLQDKPFTLDQSNGAFGLGVQYDITSHWSVRSGVMHGRVKGDDKQNKQSLQARNLRFQSTILEGNLLLTYNLLDLSQKRFSPYIFGGIAVYHFNPYTYDTLGSKIYLQPLSTEGQGLDRYPGRKQYRLTQLSIPAGVGIRLRVTDNVVLGYEVGMRKLFTDYLDDISSTYPDAIVLATAKGPKAVEMSYRGGEIKNGDPVFPFEGAIRGGAKQKDWYYFQGITLSIGLRTGDNAGRGIRQNRMGCPVRVL